MATKVTAIWRYGSSNLALADALHAAVQADAARGLRRPCSPSVQTSIWLMARAILERHEEVAEVRMAAAEPAPLARGPAPFGLAQRHEIFIATTEPHGLIEATVRRG